MSKSVSQVTFLLCLFFNVGMLHAQDSTFVLTTAMFDQTGFLDLPETEQWKFHRGHDVAWSNPSFNDGSWSRLDSGDVATARVDENGLFECWFRIRIKLDSSFLNQPIYLFQASSPATEVFINGELLHAFGSAQADNFKSHKSKVETPARVALPINNELLLAIHFVELKGSLVRIKSGSVLKERFPISLVNENLVKIKNDEFNLRQTFFNVILSIISILALLFWLLAILNRSQKHLFLIAFIVSCIGCTPLGNYLIWMVLDSESSNMTLISGIVQDIAFLGLFITIPVLIGLLFSGHIHRNLKIFVGFSLFALFSYIVAVQAHIAFLKFPMAPVPVLSFFICLYYIITERKKLRGARWTAVIGLFLALLLTLIFHVLFTFLKIEGIQAYRIHFLIPMFLIFPVSLLFYVAFWLKEMIHEVEEKAKKIIQVTEEKAELLSNQNVILENQVVERTTQLTQSLENLKSTQSQLIQSEKMASLGELTAGIAHEIQNPLNFVNNFSDLSTELIDEMNLEIEKGNSEEAKQIALDLKQNLEKINHHGKRAGDIVKGMLQHSRTSTGQKEFTDINALCDEYLRLAYHGLKAKDKSFNAKFEMDLDASLPNLNVVPQDIGRVILNLITNAFYAVNERLRQVQPDNSYEPTVSVSTKKSGDKILVSVKDNGNGIPQKVLDKIFQPFFTTKPTGQGTGLGLSLSYDIVKAHGGELKVVTHEGVGTEFSIVLPLS